MSERISDRMNEQLTTSCPRMTISTVTANLSSPGDSEHAPFDSSTGSIGSTAPGT